MTNEEIDAEISRLTRLKKLMSKKSSKTSQTDQTPLSIMQGYIDHALSKVDGDTQKEFVEFIWPQIESLGISENQKVTKEQQANINKLIANGYVQFKKSATTPESAPVTVVQTSPAPVTPAPVTSASDTPASTPKQVANTNKAVSEAKPGDWLIRKNGQKIVLKAADIAWAKNLLNKR